MNAREQKRALREEMRRRRDDIPPEVRGRWSAAICANVLAVPQFAGAVCVHVFCSFGSEPDTAPLIAAAFDAGKRVIVPVTPEREREHLHHVEIFPDQQYLPGIYGIPVPHFSDMEAYPYCEPADFFTPGDCIIVPLLAFDRNRHRLGYGRGFYDRFLEQTPGFTIGIGFCMQEIDELPAEKHDKTLDLIVTEKVPCS